MNANQDQDNGELLERSLERGRRLLEHDEQLQRLAPSSGGAVEQRLRTGTRSSIDSLAIACCEYADRPCLGQRAFEIVPESGDGERDGGESDALRVLPEFQTLSYAELWTRVASVAGGLRHSGLADTGSMVGLCGLGSPDWVVADFACLYLAAVSVPLQVSSAPADLKQIINDAELSCIVTSMDQLGLMASLLSSCRSVRSFVVMDLNEQDRLQVEAFAEQARRLQEEHGKDFAVRSLQEVERIGQKGGAVAPVVPAQGRGEPDPLMTLMYTSGSTGTPKGAMFPESRWAEQWRTRTTLRTSQLPYVTVNYMPLNHMAGRVGVIDTIVRGGLTCFLLKSDMSSLFEDIRIARPTMLMLVPRVAGMIHHHFQTELAKRLSNVGGNIGGTVAGNAGEPGDAPARPALEERLAQEIVEEMRGSFLGDRLLFASAGTAPTAPEVLAFLRRCFDIPVFDGYGSTEAGLLTLDGTVVRDHVKDFKLVDVPELGYRSTDQPYPRGELCIRSSLVIPGYYKNPAATRELFDEEGYLKTGDIVEQRGPDRVAWIDRKKNILKLSQGEFVSTSRLEELYSANSPLIASMYLYGNSARSYLLAVVVPDLEAVHDRLRHQRIEPSEAAVKQAIRGEINRVAAEAQIRSYEIPREILIEHQPFTRENGLLTESNKPSRPRLRARYGERLEGLYAEIEQNQLKELQDLQRGAGRSAAEMVEKAMEVTLGLRDIDTRQSFIQLGGDSLAAGNLTSLLQGLSGVAVPVGVALDPTSSVQTIVEYVESRLSGRGSPRDVTFEQVHGAGAQVVRAEDLRIDRFLRPEERESAARATRATALPAQARVVLLTGASGFLGRFLALELLERVPREGGKVVCVVRAPSDAVALERLSAAYHDPDPALRERFEALSAGGRLEVLAGDLVKPRLGLTEEVYDRLTDTVDTLVHNGALVNHAFSYTQLFEPNILGTVEVIRLALTRRLKAIAYVSTVGVASGLTRRDPIREDEDGRSLWRERPIDTGYAVGYATSKWAAEVLLRDLHDRYGVPVNVFRCSMIMPHSRYVGQINAGDFLTRLWCGLVDTGLAPGSFYVGGAGGRHFDGNPVDFVAGSIAGIAADRRTGDGAAQSAGHATYHVVNPHWDDGISLDVIVDWIRSGGYRIDRIVDHARWYQAFRERLGALSPAQKQRSPLPILHQWAHPIAEERELKLDARRLQQRLREISAAAEIPHLTEEYLHKCLRDMVVRALIEAPARARDA